MTKPLNSDNCAGILRAVDAMYRESDPLAAILLLCDLSDLGIKHGRVDEPELRTLSYLRDILGEIAKEQKNAQQMSS